MNSKKWTLGLENLPFFLLTVFLLCNDKYIQQTLAEFTGKDVTSLLFGSGDKSNEEIFPLAFGDFNADKLTDVFAVRRNGSDRSTVFIYFAREEEPLLKLGSTVDIFSPGQTSKEFLPVNITGISPGDFNGDGLLDAMITYEQVGVHNRVQILVCYGDLKVLNCGEEADKTVTIDDLVQEPLIIDANGDMIMDLVGEQWIKSHDSKKNVTNEKKQKFLWLFSLGSPMTPLPKPKQFDFNVDVSKIEKIPNYSPYNVSITTPSSMAYVDVDGDTVPELVIITYNIQDSHPNHPFFFIEYYQIGAETSQNNQRDTNGKWDFTLLKVIPLTTDLSSDSIQIVGQPLFLDLNQDGQLRHVLPYCRDKHCEKSGFKVISIDELGNDSIGDLEILQDDVGNDMTKWSFLHINNTVLMELHDFYGKALTFRAGDYNMDGYPDLIGTLMSHEKSESQKEYRAVIFESIPCLNRTNRKDPCTQPRSFRINLQSLSDYSEVAMATFYDIYEDGLLDVLLVRKTRNNTSELDVTKKHSKSHYGTFGRLSNPDYDANFLKVVVTTGKACPKCPLAGIPYGNIIPGPIIRYFTSTQEGDDVRAIGAQMYRSANIPLDLPYVFFGIGHSPNFIETLDVSVSPSISRKTTRKWTQLIPNSQIIILPYTSRSNHGSDWKAKIFLPSSKAALHTFGVLVGFCIFVSFIIMFFHWKERREDRKERLTYNHRFHMM